MSQQITITRTFLANVTQTIQVEIPDDTFADGFDITDAETDQWMCDNGTVLSDEWEGLASDDGLDVEVRANESRLRDVELGGFYREFGMDTWERKAVEDEAELDELGLDPDMVVEVPD